MLREARMSRMLFVALGVLFARCAHAADIEVVLEGLNPRGGKVHAFMIDDPVRFETDVQVRATVSATGEINVGVFTADTDVRIQPNQRVTLPIPPNTNKARFRFSGFPPGEYAVALYQDLDGDQKLATTLRGVPKEPWGMSNNPLLDRPAKWSDAHFTVPEEGITINIRMQ